MTTPAAPPPPSGGIPGSRHFHLALWLIAALAIGFFWWIGQTDDRTFEQLVAAGKQEVASHAAWLLKLRAAQAQLAHQQQAIGRLTTVSDSLRGVVADQRTTIANLQLPAGADSATRVVFADQKHSCLAAIDTCQARGDSARAALDIASADRTLLQAQLADAVGQANKADSVVKAGLPHCGRRVLLVWVPCPSRRAAFGLGAAAAELVRAFLRSLL